MPVYRAEIFKSFEAETWENVYHIFAGSLLVAASFAEEVLDVERTFHSDQVIFESIRTSDLVPNNNQFVSRQSGTFGSVPGSTTGPLYPLFNCWKVNFNQPVGRNSYKLYRGVIGEANASGSDISATYLTVTAVNLLDTLTATTLPEYLVDYTGAAFIGVTGEIPIVQRDLHRRKRRPTA